MSLLNSVGGDLFFFLRADTIKTSGRNIKHDNNIYRLNSTPDSSYKPSDFILCHAVLLLCCIFKSALDI